MLQVNSPKALVSWQLLTICKHSHIEHAVGSLIPYKTPISPFYDYAMLACNLKFAMLRPMIEDPHAHACNARFAGCAKCWVCCSELVFIQITGWCLSGSSSIRSSQGKPRNRASRPLVAHPSQPARQVTIAGRAQLPRRSSRVWLASKSSRKSRRSSTLSAPASVA